MFIILHCRLRGCDEWVRKEIDLSTVATKPTVDTVSFTRTENGRTVEDSDSVSDDGASV